MSVVATSPIGFWRDARKLFGQADGAAEFPALEDWTDLLADEPAAEEKPKPARKRTAKREAVSA